MAKILVSGLIEIETTVRVEGFPIHYQPVRYPFFGVETAVSGVGYNIARALTCLGDDVRLLSLIGKDPTALLVRAALERDRIAGKDVLDSIDQTAQSVILVDGEGRRQINADLKNIQEAVYPASRYAHAAQGCAALVLTNVNFSRPFLVPARRSGKLIATDVHGISDLNDPYNVDFMRAADVLFMSDEWLPVNPEEWARKVWNRYAPDILVIDLGVHGALLAVKKDNFIERLPPVHTRAADDTGGLGDALFSAFIHDYVRLNDPYKALRRAMVFASYSVGAAGALLDAAGLDALCGDCEDEATEAN